MKTRLLLYVLLGCVLISGCSTKQNALPAGTVPARTFPAGEWIDLSHALFFRDDLLAYRSGVQEGDGRGRNDRAGLLLFRLQLLCC